MLFVAQANKGKLKFEVDDLLKKYLEGVDGKQLSVKITQYRKGRSDPQNKYLWACIGIMADHFGYTKEEMYTTLCAMFLVDRSGPLPVVRGSSSLDTKEFTDFMEQIKRIAAEYDIILPDPNHFDETYPV